MDRFEELKTKYQTVLKAIQDKDVRLANLHLQDNKLLVRGAAPSQAVKNQIWDLIKIINPKYDDITADITVDESPAPKRAPAPPAPKTYTVQAGDTLSKISKHFYGDANKYMKIFEANRDKLSNPDLIKVGQVLTIPDWGEPMNVLEAILNSQNGEAVGQLARNFDLDQGQAVSAVS